MDVNVCRTYPAEPSHQGWSICTICEKKSFAACTQALVKSRVSHTAQLSTNVIYRYAPDRSQPVVDFQQDVYNISGSFNNGITEISFSRKMTTWDQNDRSLASSACYYLLYAYGGKYNNRRKTAFYHGGARRFSSTAKICFGEEEDGCSELMQLNSYYTAVNIIF